MALRMMTLSLLFLIICTFYNASGQQNIVELTEDNWKEILQNEWMVEFYAPWCPACKGLQPIWKEYATWGPDLGIKVGQIDVTTSPGLSGRFMVTALPTIYHVLNGEFRQYKGTRDKESLMNFIEEKKWAFVEPIPKWKSPDSIQMTFVASFFKMSQMLRAVHNYLMEEFGLPTWGSYLIFAVATILLGAILGLILVCIMDLVYTPKPSSKFTAEKEPHKNKTDKNSDDELADEDLKDDLLDDASSPSEDEDFIDSGNSSPSVKRRKPRKAD